MRRNAFIFLKLLLILTLTSSSSLSQISSDRKFGSGSKVEIVPNDSIVESRRLSLIEINGEKIGSLKTFIELNFTKKRFAGNAGCNQMFGRVRANGNRINFLDIGTTRMFCASPEKVMQREADLLRALEQITRFEQHGDTIFSYADERVLLKFMATPNNSVGERSAQNAHLNDKKWILVEIAGKPISKFKEKPFIVFDKRKSATGGNTGCNSFGIKYKYKGEKISIYEIISTERACIEDEQMDIEREFLNGLQRANRLEIKAGKLHLYQGAKLLLTFTS